MKCNVFIVDSYGENYDHKVDYKYILEFIVFNV